MYQKPSAQIWYMEMHVEQGTHLNAHINYVSSTNEKYKTTAEIMAINLK